MKPMQKLFHTMMNKPVKVQGFCSIYMGPATDLDVPGLLLTGGIIGICDMRLYYTHFLSLPLTLVYSKSGRYGPITARQ